MLDPPELTDLPAAVLQVHACFERVGDVRASRHVNSEGGDLSDHGRAGLLLRHTTHYLAAVELAKRLRLRGPMLDAGSGVGALSAWAAGQLGMPLHLVDHDREVRQIAASAFEQAQVHAVLADAPAATLVTAMEVLEHIPRDQQRSFVAELAARVAPGGLLVASTPDESGYAGGWSGYAPHVATLTYRGLADLLAAVTGWSVAVWRLDGGPFSLGRFQRLFEPVVNRAWTQVTTRAPVLGGALMTAGTRIGARRRPKAPVLPDAAVIRATVAPDGQGTGLLAAARRPP